MAEDQQSNDKNKKKNNKKNKNLNGNNDSNKGDLEEDDESSNMREVALNLDEEQWNLPKENNKEGKKSEDFLTIEDGQWKDDGQVDEEEEDNPWLKPTHANQNGRMKKKISKASKKSEETVEVDLDEAISLEDVEKSKGGFHLLASATKEQQELIKRTFAGDDVEKEFEKEKELLSQKEDKEPENSLPGWGQWAGQGIVPRKKKEGNKKGKNQKEESKEEERKDSKLKNVILLEKKNKHNSKYTLPKVPHPFQTKEQYERTLSNPIGKEWNTTQIFKKLIQPQIEIKPGRVIEPITMENAKSQMKDAKRMESKSTLSKKKKTHT
jgi:U3 small nucleolar RNA-associated protein 14